MIQTATTGNTMIRIATSGVEVEGGTKWTVYPESKSDPTFQKFTPEQRNRAKELAITDFRKKEDLSGHGMNKEVAEAIVRLQGNLRLDQYKDLGLVANQIDVDPKGEIAQILETEFGVKPIDTEGQAPTEIKG